MTPYRRSWLAGTLLLIAAACGGGDEPEREDAADGRPAAAETAADTRAESPPASAFASGSDVLTPEEIEAGRMDSAWRRHVELDPSEQAAASQDTQSWSDISREAVNAQIRGLPIRGDVEGPAVARVQILLDLNRFSPGAIDGRWGKNTEKAVYWFQKSNGLNASGEVDGRTLRALEGGAAGEVVTTRRLADADISGPFQRLPDDIYDRAEQPCLCYESRREQLGEVFHATPELLEQLNPDVDLDAVSAGQSLAVPAVDPFHIDALPEGKYTDGGAVARIVVSDGGHYLHALDDAGDILFHFPSTLGADYAPSPQGNFSVESVTFDPTWHYQPELLSGVDPSEDDAVLPPGPNNAVGVVWMALSEPHYGIHGTQAPETIGYATSNGCVRLTNWDAAFLGQRIPEGVPVEFRDVEDREGS